METLLRAGLSNAVTASFLALLVACLSRPLARRPAILHGLWLLVMLKLVTPPFYEVPIPWPMPASSRADAPAHLAMIRIESRERVVAQRGSAPDDLASSERSSEAISEDVAIGDLQVVGGAERPVPAPRVSSLPSYWRRWTGMVWAAGALALLIVSCRRIRRFHRLLRSTSPATGEEREWVETLASLMELRRVPEICRVPGADLTAGLVGGWRPRLVIPQDLWKALDERQRSTLIVHELAHLKRGDHLVRFLELLVTALYWWHPLVWWIRHCLRDAEEQCCDAWVVWAFPEAARSYAETLLDTLDFVHRSDQPEPLLASGLGKVPHLRRRLTMILTGTTFRVLGVRGTLGLLALAGVMLPVGATWAQKADEKKDVRIVVKQGDGPVEVAADEFALGELHITADASSDQPSQKSEVVVVQVDRQDKPGDEIRVSGSIDDVIKTLEGQVQELKKGGEPSDSARDRIKSLVRALDELKKAKESVTVVPIRIDFPFKVKEFKTAQYHVVDVRSKDGPSGEKAAEVAKIRQEISQLKRTLKVTLGQITEARAKLQKLGEDPGELPVLEYRGAQNNRSVEYKTYTIAEPVEVSKIDPSTKPEGQKDSRIELKTYTIAKPVEVAKEHKAEVVVKRIQEKKQAGETLDATRIEILEKRLKALQDEVDRLKKGSQ